MSSGERTLPLHKSSPNCPLQTPNRRPSAVVFTLMAQIHHLPLQPPQALAAADLYHLGAARLLRMI